MKKAILVIVIIAVVLGAGYYLSTVGEKGASNQNQSAVQNNFNHVPTDSELLNNLHKAGLDALTAEGTVMHIHVHLDMVINGENITIPAGVGINESVTNSFISPIHTHDTSGVLHVESPVKKDYTLGEFFTEWGITLNDNCVGTYCADSGHKFIAAVNGKQVSNIQNYVLNAHDEIEIWYGPKNENPKLISSYNFASGL